MNDIINNPNECYFFIEGKKRLCRGKSTSFSKHYWMWLCPKHYKMVQERFEEHERLTKESKRRIR